jgi:hypothetical protein
MYVHTACDHAFFDIEEDLTVLAFFGAPMRFGQSGTGSGNRPGIGIQADPEIL